MAQKLTIYRDIRDYFIRFEIPVATKFQTARLKYNREEKNNNFILYNDICKFLNGYGDTINYLKVCHIIVGKKADNYEYLNLKHKETLYLNLYKGTEDDVHHIYIIYYTNNKRYFYNLSDLYKDNKDNFHIHFKYGNPKNIEIYKMYTTFLKLVYILIFLFLMILLYIIFVSSCSTCN